MKKFFTEGKSQLAALTAFFTSGALMATWVARIPLIQSKLNLNEAGLGLVLLGMSVGELTSLSLSGGLIARYSSRKVTLIGGLGMAAGLFLLALAPSPLVLFITLLIFGGMLSSMDVAMNEQAVLVERNAGRALMSSFHAVYSIGALFGSLISAGMASLPQFPLALHFALMAVLFGAILLSVYPHMIPTSTEATGKKVPFQFPQRAVWALGAIAFCASMGEIAMADWSGVYLVHVLKTDAAFAALGYAAFSLTMTAGRMLGDAIARARKPADIVRLGGIIYRTGLAGAGLHLQPDFGDRRISPRWVWGCPTLSRWCSAQPAISPGSHPARALRVWPTSATWGRWWDRCRSALSPINLRCGFPL